LTNKAAIDAQVVDVQNDRSHKGFIKITLHLADERGGELTHMFGKLWPTYTNPIPVALALLSQGEDVPAVTNRLREQPSKHTVTRAAILCSDPRFQKFLDIRYAGKPPNIDVIDEDSAATMVRYVCRVNSRKEILPGTPAETRWNLLLSGYIAWKDHDMEATA
jgi:hypothetical protein